MPNMCSSRDPFHSQLQGPFSFSETLFGTILPIQKRLHKRVPTGNKDQKDPIGANGDTADNPQNSMPEEMTVSHLLLF